MLRPLTLALLAGAAFVAAAGLAEAKSIKHDVPAATLASFCAEHGVGSESSATFTAADGTTLTGTIHCEAEDLVAGNDDDPATHDVGDDHRGGREAEPGDDHGGHGNEAGDDHGGGSDDNSGSGHGGESEASDDHGGHGGRG